VPGTNRGRRTSIEVIDDFTHCLQPKYVGQYLPNSFPFTMHNCSYTDILICPYFFRFLHLSLSLPSLCSFISLLPSILLIYCNYIINLRISNRLPASAKMFVFSAKWKSHPSLLLNDQGSLSWRRGGWSVMLTVRNNILQMLRQQPPFKIGFQYKYIYIYIYIY
jgi:hypothetical protein